MVSWAGLHFLALEMLRKTANEPPLANRQGRLVRHAVAAMADYQ
jgi:hypothetical protein